MKNEVSVVHKKIDSVNKELTSYVFCKIGKILTVYHRLYTIYLDCEYSLILDLSQLKDPSFRPHILVQGLILFNYLKSPGKNDKDLPSDTMKKEIKTCEERVKKLLEMTPPKGK